MTYLVLVRHGQSTWNKENRFTGWVDVDLTPEGVKEAKKAGKLLAKEDIPFDIGFSSVQKRAVRTLWMMLEGIDQVHIPVTKDWHLNERHYGALTGLNKQETRDKHGDEQVHIWRRSYDTPPPKIGPDNEYHPSNDPKYKGIAPSALPGGESLEMTTERVLPYFNDQIALFLKANNNVIISAHGNSLRALMKELFDVPDADIPGYEFPTGNPLLIELAPGTLDVVSARYLDESRAKPLPPLPEEKTDQQSAKNSKSKKSKKSAKSKKASA